MLIICNNRRTTVIEGVVIPELNVAIADYSFIIWDIDKDEYAAFLALNPKIMFFGDAPVENVEITTQIKMINYAGDYLMGGLDTALNINAWALIIDYNDLTV